MILSVLPLNLLHELIPCETSINWVSHSWALCPRATLVLLLTGLHFWKWFISFMHSYTHRHFPCSHHKHSSAGWFSAAASMPSGSPLFSVSPLSLGNRHHLFLPLSPALILCHPSLPNSQSPSLSSGIKVIDCAYASFFKVLPTNVPKIL